MSIPAIVKYATLRTSSDCVVPRDPTNDSAHYFNGLQTQYIYIITMVITKIRKKIFNLGRYSSNHTPYPTSAAKGHINATRSFFFFFLLQFYFLFYQKRSQIWCFILNFMFLFCQSKSNVCLYFLLSRARNFLLQP